VSEEIACAKLLATIAGSCDNISDTRSAGDSGGGLYFAFLRPRFAVFFGAFLAAAFVVFLFFTIAALLA
jgi:hypothetical protein